MPSTVAKSQKVLQEIKKSLKNFVGQEKVDYELFLLSITPDKSDYELSFLEQRLDRQGILKLTDMLARDFVFRDRRVEAFYQIKEINNQLLVSVVSNDSAELNKTLFYNITKERGKIKNIQYSKTTDTLSFVSELNEEYFKFIKAYHKAYKEFSSE